MSGGGLGSTGVTQSGGGSSFGMSQPSQNMGQMYSQPMMPQQPMQGPFGGQFGFQQPQQFGFQQPQPFYQQQFNPYAMASQAQRLGISQVPIRNQYGPYGGQMYQQPYQQPMQQPMQQSQTNYPQPMGYPQSMQDPITTRTLGDEQYQNKLNFARQQLKRRGIPYNFGHPQFNPNQSMHHGMVSTQMPQHMMPQEMQGPDVSDTLVDVGRIIY